MELALLFSSESDSSDSSTDEEDVVFEEVVKYINLRKKTKLKFRKLSKIEEIIIGYNEAEFISQFRIRREIFEQLVMHYEESNFYKSLFVSRAGGRPPLTPQKNLLVFLYFVGSQSTKFREIHDIFGVSLGTLHELIRRVAEFLCSLGPEIIKWPDESQTKEIKTYFGNAVHIPEVRGVLGTTYILTEKPSKDPNVYVNRYGKYSVQLQAVVDHRKKFTDVFIGYPGSIHTATVFTNSSIYNKLPQSCKGGYLIGNEEYPLMKHVLTPYTTFDCSLNERQHYYNSLHLKTLRHISEAFDLLRRRFRQLHQLKLRKPKLIVQVIKACCILHNLANFEDLDHLDEPVPPQDNVLLISPMCVGSSLQESEEAEAVRHNLMNQLWEQHFSKQNQKH